MGPLGGAAALRTSLSNTGLSCLPLEQVPERQTLLKVARPPAAYLPPYRQSPTHPPTRYPPAYPLPTHLRLQRSPSPALASDGPQLTTSNGGWPLAAQRSTKPTSGLAAAPAGPTSSLVASRGPVVCVATEPLAASTQAMQARQWPTLSTACGLQAWRSVGVLDTRQAPHHQPLVFARVAAHRGLEGAHQALSV